MGFTFETRTQVVSLTDRGMLRATYKSGVDVVLQDAQEVIHRIAALSNGIRYPILIDITGIRSMTREARACFAGPATAEIEAAAALLVLSPMARAIGNFFLGLNKAAIPTRLFTSEPLAIEWLAPYLP